MPRVLRYSCGMIASLMLGTVIGCGGNPPTYPVKGKVVFTDGAPVTWGRVECLSQEGDRTAAGEIKPDGGFELSTFGDRDGAVAGRHRLIVVQFASAALSDPRAPHTKTHTEPQRFVSRKYADYDSSELFLDVASSGENTPTVTVSSQ